MFLADEGLNGNIVRELRAFGFPIIWILEINPGISDEEVIEYAQENKKILITEDKDFGEWVFAHNIKGLSIIFLRYEKKDYERIVDSLKNIAFEFKEKKLNKSHLFVTINKNKVRRRKF